MRLDQSQLEQFITCIEKTFNVAELGMFTSFQTNMLGKSLEDIVPVADTLTWIQIINRYLTFLNNEAKALVFFHICWEHKKGFNQLEEAQKLRPLLAHSAIDTDGNIQLHPAFFDIPLLKAKKLPFIDRKNVQHIFRKLIHNEENKCILINGPSKTGLSYIRYYIDELANLTGRFKAVYVDFRKLSPAAGGPIQVADIARYLKRQIPDFNPPFDFDIAEQFKYDEFIGVLREFLGNSPDTYLFFFDHFNILYSNEVKQFINELVENAVEDGGLINNYYVVLANFDGARDWDMELTAIVGAVKLTAFTREQVIEFIEKVYAKLSEHRSIDFDQTTLIEFLEANEPFLAPELFTPSTINVKSIGANMMDWLKRFKQQIETT